MRLSSISGSWTHFKVTHEHTVDSVKSLGFFFKFFFWFTSNYSEVMQHGASLSSSQLLKILTRGKTNRLSAESLLDFFNPLKAWLEQQNRNDIIGWNSNMEDVALFKALNGAPTQTHHTILTHLSICTITILLYLF